MGTEMKVWSKTNMAIGADGSVPPPNKHKGISESSWKWNQNIA